MSTTISEQPIMSFMNDIISYLNKCFENENKISPTKKLVGNLAFTTKMIKDATKSFYVVKCISNQPQDETFRDVKTIKVYIQIDVYALKGSYDKVQYLAEPMSIILQTLISKYMRCLKYGDENPNIRLMREMSSSPAMPFEDGAKAYQSSLRYEIVIMKDYEIADQ